MYRDLGYRDGQAEVLNYLGEVLTRSGDSGEARDHYARALAIAREINTPLEEARALEGLGHCLFRDGDPGAAARWEQALAIYERIGAPDARRIQDSLRQQGIATGPAPWRPAPSARCFRRGVTLPPRCSALTSSEYPGSAATAASGRMERCARAALRQ